MIFLVTRQGDIMLAKLKTLTVVAAACAAFSGASGAATYVDVRVAPPAPRMEVVPVARPGYVWVPGHWDWRGHRHVWVGGHWERERRGYVYQNPTWVHDGDRWVLRRGAWSRGDRDRDGVPNRYDNDRDGDRVPNRYDHHPNNPRRP
jgi:hypothetical protein